MVLMTQEKNRQLQKNLPKKLHGKRFAKKESYGGAFNPFVKLKLTQQIMNTQWINFLIEKIIAAGLKPNEKQETLSILRRLSYALTGLPPSIEQQNRFTDTLLKAFNKPSMNSVMKC